MTLLSLFLAALGFALFASATDLHGPRFAQAALTPMKRRNRRIAAWITLAAALPPAIASGGWIFGPVLWSGLVMLGAGLVFILLNLVFAPSSNMRGASRKSVERIRS